MKNILYTKPIRSLAKGIPGVGFVSKIIALTKRHIIKKVKDKSLLEFTEADNYLNKFLARILIGGGISVFLNLALKKKLHTSINKRKLSELEKLTKALKATHTPEQQRLWGEIERAVQENNKQLGGILSSPLVGSDGRQKTMDVKNVLGLLLAGKSEGKLKAKAKWIDMKTREYEDSLDNNQSIIYKNIFETEYDIMSNDKILSSVLTYGIPMVVMGLMSIGQSDDIKSWESMLK